MITHTFSITGTSTRCSTGSCGLRRPKERGERRERERKERVLSAGPCKNLKEEERNSGKKKEEWEERENAGTRTKAQQGRATYICLVRWRRMDRITAARAARLHHPMLNMVCSQQRLDGSAQVYASSRPMPDRVCTPITRCRRSHDSSTINTSDALQDAGCRAMNLGDNLFAPASGTRLPAAPICISFTLEPRCIRAITSTSTRVVSSDNRHSLSRSQSRSRSHPDPYPYPNPNSSSSPSPSPAPTAIPLLLRSQP